VIEYNTALFTESRMQQLQDDFVLLLEQVAANAETTLAALSASVPVAANEEISSISSQISSGISTDY
jgi:hypothetical protein